MIVPPPDAPQEPIPRKGDEKAYNLAKKLLADGVAADSVRQSLLELGLNDKTATAYVGHLLASPEFAAAEGRPGKRDQRKRGKLEADARQEAARRRMWQGAGLFAAGLLATVVSTLLSGGGVTILFWGAMLGGVILFVRGVWQLG